MIEAHFLRFIALVLLFVKESDSRRQTRTMPRFDYEYLRSFGPFGLGNNPQNLDRSLVIGSVGGRPILDKMYGVNPDDIFIDRNGGLYYVPGFGVGRFANTNSAYIRDYYSGRLYNSTFHNSGQLFNWQRPSAYRSKNDFRSSTNKAIERRTRYYQEGRHPALVVNRPKENRRESHYDLYLRLIRATSRNS